MPLKFIKSRNVTTKLIDDYTYKSMDDNNVNDMITDFMSEDAFDEEGNKHTVDGSSSGNIIIRRMENHLQKLQETIKNLTPEELQKLKTELPKEFEKIVNSEKLDKNLFPDINNIENYLGQVEVLTVIRRRVFDIYELK